MSSKETTNNNNLKKTTKKTTIKRRLRRKNLQPKSQQVISEKRRRYVVSSTIRQRRNIINEDKAILQLNLVAIENFREETIKFASKHKPIANILIRKLLRIDDVIENLRKLCRQLSKLWHITWLSKNSKK